MRPRRPTDRQLAYAQSEWMVEYLVQRFGYDVLPKMLEAFRRGSSQEVVFREAVGIETAAFDADFAAWARTEAGDWGFDLTHPENVIKLRAETVIKPGDAVKTPPRISALTHRNFTITSMPVWSTSRICVSC